MTVSTHKNKWVTPVIAFGLGVLTGYLFYRFVTKESSSKQWFITINSSCNTSPNGYVAVTEGNSLRVTVTPCPNIVFMGWKLDGTEIGYEQTIDIPPQITGSKHILETISI